MVAAPENARQRKEVMEVMSVLGRVARACAVLACVALVFAVAAPAGRADEVGITGTVTPNTFEVVVSPTVVDLSCRAGESPSADIWIENRGTIGATVTVSDVTFSGLVAVGPDQFSATDESCADKCVLTLSLLMNGRAN